MSGPVERIVVPKPNHLRRNLIILGVTALIVGSAWFAGFDLGRILLNLRKGGRLLGRMFLRPDWSYAGRIVDPLMETIRMSVVGTFWGAVLAGVLVGLAVALAPLIIWQVGGEWVSNTYGKPYEPFELLGFTASAAVLDQAEQELREYFAGTRQNFDVPLAPVGTAFRHEVWAALRTIPFGHVWSYAKLAVAVGRPKGPRAVGQANGQNPVAIIIPCHRVIAADGTLGGYGGGLDRKAWLLAHEGVTLVG